VRRASLDAYQATAAAGLALVAAEGFAAVPSQLLGWQGIERPLVVGASKLHGFEPDARRVGGEHGR
jgi:hypothetical protein